MEVASRLYADIVVQDRDEQAVLLVEVKRHAGDETVRQIALYMQAASTTIPFAMLVDLEEIRIFQWDGTNLSEPICSLKTADILNHYDPEFVNKQIFGAYLETLVEAWLRDLAYRWKSETPPAAEQLAAIGLLQRLEGGTTLARAVLSGDTLHRD